MPADPPIVFFLGTGRCGSSLVHEIVARHPDVGFVSNLEDRFPVLAPVGRWNRAIYRATPEHLTRKGRARFAPSEAYRALDREVSPVVSEPFRDLTGADATPWLTGRLREFFGRRIAAQDAAVFTHKFTGWPRVGLIRAAFPDARFVHVVRDGRAVANSWLQMGWWDGFRGPDQWRFGPLPERYRQEWEDAGRSHVVLAGIAWKLLLDAFDQARKPVTVDAWLELRYEDLLAEPSGTIERVVEFCGLRFHDELADHLRRHPPRRDRERSFLSDLDPVSVELLTTSLADHLEARGYTVGPDPTDGVSR